MQAEGGEIKAPSGRFSITRRAGKLRRNPCASQIGTAARNSPELGHKPVAPQPRCRCKSPSLVLRQRLTRESHRMTLEQKLQVCEAMLARLDAAMTSAEAEVLHSSALEQHLRRLLTNLEAEQARLGDNIQT